MLCHTGVQILNELDQELWSSGDMECFPQSLTVHRIEGSLDINVSHMQRFSKFTMQLSQETQCQYGVYCRTSARETRLLWSLLTCEDGLQTF